MSWDAEDDRKYWEGVYGHPLSDDEAADIRRNLVQFVKLLIEEHRRQEELAAGGVA